MSECLRGSYLKLTVVCVLVAVLGVLSGCLGEGGGGGAVVNFTPEQEFYRVKLTFHEENIKYSKTLLDEHLKQLRNLEKKTDNRALKIGIHRYIALDLYLKARLESFETVKDEKSFQRRLDRAGEAEKILLKLVEVDPENLDCALILGLTEQLLGQLQPDAVLAAAHLEHALKYFRKVRLTDPGFESTFLIGGHPVTALDALLAEADVYRCLGRFQIAATWFERALASDPTVRRRSNYRIPKALLAADMLYWDEAIALLELFKGDRFRDDPDWGMGLWLLKGIYQRMLEIGNSEYQTDIQTVTDLLKDSNNYFSGTKISLFLTVLKMVPPQRTRLVKALRIMDDGRWKDAETVLVSLLNDPDTTGWYQSGVVMSLDRCREHLAKSTAERRKSLSAFIDDYPLHPGVVEMQRTIDRIDREVRQAENEAVSSPGMKPPAELPGLFEGDGPYLVWPEPRNDKQGRPSLRLEAVSGQLETGPVTVLGTVRGTDFRKLAEETGPGVFSFDFFTGEQLQSSEARVLDITMNLENQGLECTFAVPLPPEKDMSEHSEAGKK